MSGKDAQPSTWRKRLTAAGFALIVIGTCIAIRCLESAPTASAQQPQAKGRAAKPAASPNRRSQEMSQAVAAPTADIVAIVNGQKIERAQLAKECIRRFGEDVLESEVNKRLILAACAAKGVKVSALDVESEVARMARKFEVPKDQWLAMLEDERGIKASQYRRDIVWPTLALKRLAAESLEVSDAEVKKAYQSEYGAMVQVRMIATKSKAKADKLAAALKAAPKRFGALAKEHSEDLNSAAAQGMIPPIRRHLGDEQVEKVAFGLQEGAVSSVIPVSGQYVILRCDRQIPPQKIGEAQQKAILVALRDRISESKLRSEGKKMFAKLQQRAEIINVYNNEKLRKEMPGIAATVNGKQISMKHLGEQCLIRNGLEVLESEINRRLLEQALQRRSLQVAKADLNAEISRAAESFGFFTKDGKPDVSGWLKNVTNESGASVDVYVRDAVWPSVALKKLVGSQVKVTEDDMKKAFAANFGERVEALAIVLSDQRTAHEVFDLARKNDTEKFFGELANQYSIEPVSKANYGQVPPIRRHGGQDALEREAFQLQPGQTSGVIAVGDKFIIVRCLGRTKPVVDEAQVVDKELRSDIREKKLRVAMAKTFDKLKQSARIENYLAKSIPTTSQPAIQRVSHEQPVGNTAQAPARANRRR